ncbi:hypothetical protein V6N12_003275 [Hibiscus sabdariffa]|uniref:Uncharacterized protein n=1 Tax=Hibiscus sabdariffa TaxID=183260 RepID=A0ABR2EDJ5_9ROSI
MQVQDYAHFLDGGKEAHSKSEYSCSCVRSHLVKHPIQAALPPGVVPFVFTKEYNVYPDTLSTGVIFGMLIAVPVALIYYLILAL